MAAARGGDAALRDDLCYAAASIFAARWARWQRARSGCMRVLREGRTLRAIYSAHTCQRRRRCLHACAAPCVPPRTPAAAVAHFAVYRRFHATCHPDALPCHYLALHTFPSASARAYCFLRARRFAPATTHPWRYCTTHSMLRVLAVVLALGSVRVPTGDRRCCGGRCVWFASYRRTRIY